MSDQTTDIDVMAVNLLQRERIAELEAEVERLRMNLDAYKQAEELWCRQDEKREAENQRLKEVKEAAEKMITEGYADSFSNWVCPSEYAFPLEQALAAIGEG